MTGAKRKIDSRVLLSLFLVALGLVGGIGMRAWMVSRDARMVSGEAADTDVFRTTLSSDSSSLWAKLVGLLGQGSSRRFTFERLAAVLSKQSKDPLAQAFAEEFLNDPELRGYWNEYLHAKDALGISGLAEKLAKSSRFAKLLNRFAQNSRFLSLSESLLEDLSRVPGEGGGNAGAGAQLAGVASGVWRGAAGYDPVRPAGAKGGNGPSGLYEGAPMVAGAGPTDGPAAWEKGADAPSVADSKGADSPEVKAVDVTQSGEKDANDVDKKLAELRLAGPSRELLPWASLCYRENTSISRDECSAINRYLGEEALWNACHKAGLLERCVTLCQNLPELSCGAQANAMQRCRAQHTAERCAQACSTGPDCAVQEPSDGPPVEPGEPPPVVRVPLGQILDRMNDLWQRPGPDEQDWPQYNGTLALVQERFNPSPEVFAKFKADLRVIIQESPNCMDACEKTEAMKLIKETFNSQISTPQ